MPLAEEEISARDGETPEGTKLMISDNSCSSDPTIIRVGPITGDATPRVLAAIEKVGDNAIIQFSDECYHFWPENAYEAYYYISNNQHGLKRIAFPLVGKKNLTIDGGGARFVFHNEIVPFVVDSSENLTLCDFSVDWERPFFSQGEVVESDRDGVVVSVDSDTYPHRIENRRLVFVGEGWESHLTEGVFAFSPKTSLGYPEEIEVEPLGVGLFRLCENFPNLPEPGDLIVFRHYRRRSPAIFMIQAKKLCFESVTLNHAGGMGFIAQFCEDVELRRCKVSPSRGRIFSVCADASHFVNCRGLIQLKDCLFENQLDDPLNVDGLNTRISEVADEHTIIVERVHREQQGVTIGFAGDAVQFSHNQTLLSYSSNVIREVNSIDARFARVSFVNPLPQTIYPGHVVENLS